MPTERRCRRCGRRWRNHVGTRTRAERCGTRAGRGAGFSRADRSGRQSRRPALPGRVRSGTQAYATLAVDQRRPGRGAGVVSLSPPRTADPGARRPGAGAALAAAANSRAVHPAGHARVPAGADGLVVAPEPHLDGHSPGRPARIVLRRGSAARRCARNAGSSPCPPVAHAAHAGGRSRRPGRDLSDSIADFWRTPTMTPRLIAIGLALLTALWPGT